MSLEVIRTNLVAMHSAIANMGQVHGRQRYARDEARFRSLFTTDSATDALAGQVHVRGWHWSRAGSAESLLNTETSVIKHRWQCRGYLSLLDDLATELIFDGLVERLCAAYRADPGLGGTADASPMDSEPFGIQVLEAGPILFCGVLCHGARLQLTTWSYA